MPNVSSIEKGSPLVAETGRRITSALNELLSLLRGIITSANVFFLILLLYEKRIWLRDSLSKTSGSLLRHSILVTH